MRPTRLDIVSTPAADFERIVRTERLETVNLLLDILKVTYGRDAETFTWAADRLEQETRLSGVINHLQFKPQARAAPPTRDAAPPNRPVTR